MSDFAREGHAARPEGLWPTRGATNRNLSASPFRPRRRAGFTELLTASCNVRDCRATRLLASPEKWTPHCEAIMHEREIRAFITIAEIGRMDLAAKKLGYSQPAISYQIICLEKALGIKLFTRNSGGTTLTREGQMILSSARATLMLIDNIKKECSDIRRASTALAAVAP